MKAKRLSLILVLALVISLIGPIPVQAEEIPDVTEYSYTVTPILSPFTYYLYVKTDNPDPTSFRLVDKSSKFYGPDDYGHISVDSGNGYGYFTEVDPGTYYAAQNLYPDVVYEDESTWRVPGGYIFRAENAYSDGGEFTLLQKTHSGDNILHDRFEQTDITIPCQALNTRVSYLIDTCTTDEMSFFEKLDAVQARLDEIAVYPRYVYDINSPNEERPYPLLAASPYPELELNQHYSMYNILGTGILTSNAYPFVLDSLGVPGTIGAVAEALEPDCEVVSNTYHYLVDITFEGETRSYGGSGAGGNDPLYSNRVKKSFTFQGGDDLGTGGTVDEYNELLRSYQPIAAEDARMYRDQIAGTTFDETIRATGGTWIRIATEGFGYGTSYGYVVPLGSDTMVLSDAWVDGRYIGDHEAIVKGGTFEEHPTADIVLHDVTYTDYYGQTHTQDVIYVYSEERDAWIAPNFYENLWHGTSLWPLPEELVLTHAEVDAMDLDSNSSSWPEGGLVYDGTEYPGTPFTRKIVTGVHVPETLDIYVDQQETITAVVEPADAADTRVSWTSSNPSVVEVVSDSGGTIRGVSEGTAVLTVVTSDGSYSAACTVTVLPTPDPCANGHSYDNDRDAVCNICGHTREIEIETETISIYRLYNPYTNEHLLTSGEEEVDILLSLGWTLDGIAWEAPTSGEPVYRLYNPYDDWHFYTMSQEEVDTLTPLGWQVDGVVSYSASAEDGVPIYRLFNPYETKNYHHYTADESERDWNVSLGWKLEGIAWYGKQLPAAEGGAPETHTHSYTETVTEPTCTADGYTAYTCSCGDSYTDDETAATGHTWGKWTRTKEPTISEAGEDTRTCSACSTSETRSVDKLPEEDNSDDDAIDTSGSYAVPEIVDIINEYRAAAGLSPLTYYWDGQEAANLRAAELCISFSHESPEGSNGRDVMHSYGLWGECISGYYGAQETVDVWMGSQVHHDTLMRAASTIAVVACNNGNCVLLTD